MGGIGSKAKGGVEWPVIGIDLGTTYSCVAVWRDDRVEIIPNDQGNRTTPSCVAFSDSERLIGEAAVNQATMNSVNTVFDAKRLIGRKFSDESVKEDMKFWPFKVVDGVDLDKEDKPLVAVTYMGEQRTFIPEEISAMVLTKMKGIAEAFLGTTVRNAIITVPAYFNDTQRRATKDAGTIAGLNVIRIINEPTAAAMAYGLDTKIHWKINAARKNVLVFDLGGGTFDVSLVAMDKGEIKVKAICGDSHLGGADFDNRMVSEFVEEFKRKHNTDISNNPRAIGRLKAASERAKRVLSSTPQTTIETDCLFEGIDFRTSITRARFERLNMDLFRQFMETVDKCLKDAGMVRSSVHEVVLVGRSWRIPKIQQMLQEMFNGKELCKTIHPDEAVAYGAAAQAAILGDIGTSNKGIVLDVTPLSLGLEDTDKKINVYIPRNTTIPVKMNCSRVTAEDNQTSVCFRVFEGERLMSKDNNFLDEFTISGFPPAPKGQTVFDVWFEIDVNGILNVSAVELGTGLNNQVAITYHRGRHSEEEIDRMVKEGEKYRAQDEERRKTLAAKMKLEMYANEVWDALLHNYAKFDISESDRQQVHTAVEEILEWLKEKSDTSKSSEFVEKLKELEIICKDFNPKLHL